jgi:hypothetical protein
MFAAANKFPDVSSLLAASRAFSYICVAKGKSPVQCRYSPYVRTAFSAINSNEIHDCTSQGKKSKCFKDGHTCLVIAYSSKAILGPTKERLG